MTPSDRPLVTELLPGLAAEIAHGLTEANQIALVEQVGSLRVIELCSCGDDFCASFRTRPKGDRPPGELDNLMPPVESGMVILDVVGGIITYVEVLFRDDVKAVLDAYNAGS